MPEIPITNLSLPPSVAEGLEEGAVKILRALKKGRRIAKQTNLDETLTEEMQKQQQKKNQPKTASFLMKTALCKAASEVKPRKNMTVDEQFVTGLPLATALGVTGIASGELYNKTVGTTTKLQGPPGTTARAREIAAKAKKLMKLEDVPVYLGSRAPSTYRNAGPAFWAQEIGGRRGGVVARHGRLPNTVLHELGHAKHLGGKPVKQQIYHNLSRIGPLAGLMVAGGLLADDDTRPYAPVAAVAGSLPMLIPEIQASRLGLKAGKKILTRGEYRLARKTSLKALGTYAVPGIAATVGAGILSKVLSNKHKEKKTPKAT